MSAGRSMHTMFVLHSPYGDKPERPGPSWRGWEKCSGASATACAKVLDQLSDLRAVLGECAHADDVPLGDVLEDLDNVLRTLVGSQPSGTVMYDTREDAEAARKILDPDDANGFVVWPIRVEVPNIGVLHDEVIVDLEFNPAFREWLSTHISDCGEIATPQDWYSDDVHPTLAGEAARELGTIDRLGFPVGSQKFWYWPNGEFAGGVSLDGLDWVCVVYDDQGVGKMDRAVGKYEDAVRTVREKLAEIGFKEGAS